MQKNTVAFLITAYCLLLTSESNSFNVFYNGTDAEISYQTSWGKERFVKEDYIRYFPLYKKYVESTKITYFTDMSHVNTKELPYPYCTLDSILPFQGAGAYFNSEFISKLFKFNTIGNAIEIGSDHGLSTRHIASLVPEGKKLYAIDTWGYHAVTFATFLSNVVRSGLTHKIIPIQNYSNEAIKQMTAISEHFDFIYIDGDHETAGVLSDLELYFPLAGDKGIVCGDDWLLTTVRTAVLQFAQEHQLTVYADCNFWFLKNEGLYKVSSLLEAPDKAWKF